MAWWVLFTTDVVTKVAFGEDPQMVQLGYKDQLTSDFETTIKLGGVRSEMPPVYDLVRKIPHSGLQHVMNASTRTLQHGEHAIKRVREGTLGSDSVLATLLASQEKSGGFLMSDAEVSAEAGGHIIAGSGTTTTVLTYLVWAVLKHPNVQGALEDELKRCLGDQFTDEDLMELPFLNGVLQEALRLYGSVPASLPRVVPQGGAYFQGYRVPEGTIVSAQTFSINRNPKIYSEPEK